MVGMLHSNANFSVYRLGLVSQVSSKLLVSSLTHTADRKALLRLEETLKHSRAPEGVGTEVSSFSVLYQPLL